MIKIRKLIFLQGYYLIYKSFLILPTVLYAGPKHFERAWPTLLSLCSVALSPRELTGKQKAAWAPGRAGR